MTLEYLGYKPIFEQFRKENGLADFPVARITARHKERYSIIGPEGEASAEITGNMRYAAERPEDFPTVGDWVALSVFEPELSVIVKLFPRYSLLARKAVDSEGERQTIAANIDFSLLVQSADRDFNMNRLERYIELSRSAGTEPIAVLTKTDTIGSDELAERLKIIEQRLPNLPVYAISNLTGQGLDALEAVFQKGQSYCLLGSSGVGKSTLLNRLLGEEKMLTKAISPSTGKGRHGTVHRELVMLPGGGLIIDNPGMRELGLTGTDNDYGKSTDRISELAQNCKFKDCTHTSETGCAVLTAMEQGELQAEAYHNFIKIQKEKAHFESTEAERRRKGKAFGRIVKDIKRNHGKYK